MERDIVERLREGTGPIKPNLIDDAADTIERLRARVGQLEADASALAAERDEARREVCSLFESSIAYSMKTGIMGFAIAEYESLLNYARARGWDCFKEDGK